MNNMRLFAALILLGIFGGYVDSADPKQAPLSDSDSTCSHPAYNIHIFSISPLVIYISNFISSSERAHLLSVTYIPPLLPLLPYSSSHRRLILFPAMAHSPTPPSQTKPAHKVCAQHAPRNPRTFHLTPSWTASRNAPLPSNLSPYRLRTSNPFS
jgi:hypothetical protein